ncbi:hypothetical protein FGB62_133g014 [Gracilaria domingensis]|nr:hypothetical protein FGB62_133g014 [Gracilaria domingensis]
MSGENRGREGQKKGAHGVAVVAGLVSQNGLQGGGTHTAEVRGERLEIGDGSLGGCQRQEAPHAGDGARVGAEGATQVYKIGEQMVGEQRLDGGRRRREGGGVGERGGG